MASCSRTSCNRGDVIMNEKQPFVKIENLKKYYDVSNRSFFGRGEKAVVKALDGITIEIERGEIIGLAGESGSGKTTTGEILVRLQNQTEGKITIGDITFTNTGKMSRCEEKKFRKNVQMIFQDPYETLNPRFTIFKTIAEPLIIHGMKNKQEIETCVIEALEKAELRPAENFINRYPHELSGGQRQRVAIARSIVLEPKVLVADEPVSMLDVSIRAGILNLLRLLREDMNLTMLYISHDLSTIKYLCDNIVIMYLGKIMEYGPVNEVIEHPQHPYTKALLSAVPVPNPDYDRQRIEVDEEVADQINLPKGCRFAPRCPFVTDACHTVDHILFERQRNHFSACILQDDEQMVPTVDDQEKTTV